MKAPAPTESAKMAKVAKPVLAGKVSKNQRVGVKLAQREWYCEQDHKMRTVKIIPAKGHAYIGYVCECNGYRPLDLSLPFATIKATGIPGKKRDFERGGEARLVT
jgi:hypothetical protein